MTRGASTHARRSTAAEPFVVIVNELVTNAIKHAFPDGMSGRIVIRFAPTELEGEPALALSIEDDGVGMPAEAASKGLGQTVIASLLPVPDAGASAVALALHAELRRGTAPAAALARAVAAAPPGCSGFACFGAG